MGFGNCLTGVGGNGCIGGNGCRSTAVAMHFRSPPLCSLYARFLTRATPRPCPLWPSSQPSLSTKSSWPTFSTLQLVKGHLNATSLTVSSKKWKTSQSGRLLNRNNAFQVATAGLFITTVSQIGYARWRSTVHINALRTNRS